MGKNGHRRNAGGRKRAIELRGQIRVLGIHPEIERQFFRQAQAILRHVGGTFIGSQNAIPRPDTTGAGIVEPLVRLPRVDLVGREQHFVAPFLDDGGCMLIQTRRVPVIRIGLRVLEPRGGPDIALDVCVKQEQEGLKEERPPYSLLLLHNTDAQSSVCVTPQHGAGEADQGGPEVEEAQVVGRAHLPVRPQPRRGVTRQPRVQRA